MKLDLVHLHNFKVYLLKTLAKMENIVNNNTTNSENNNSSESKSCETNSPDKSNSTLDSHENKQIQTPPSYLLYHYHIIGDYLRNWVENVATKWKTSLVELRDILKKYSDPHIDIPLIIDELDDEDLVANNTTEGDRLLNTYSLIEILGFLDMFGIKTILSNRGYKDIKLIPDYSDAFVHRVKITDSSIEGARGADSLLMDIFIRRKDLYVSDFLESHNQSNETPSSPAGGIRGEIERHLPQYALQGEPYHWQPDEPSEDIVKRHFTNVEVKATIIEWLSLQDPKKEFSHERPPLPGQQYPGLGIAKQMDQLLVFGATKSNRDCLLNTPYRFYNAFMYQAREYFFVDPSIQSFFLSLYNDLEPIIEQLGLAPVSWAFEFGCVKEKSSGNRVTWEFHKQIRPLSNKLKNYFKSKDYTSYIQRNTKKGMFYIDWNGHPSLAHFYIPPNNTAAKTTTEESVNKSDSNNSEVVTNANEKLEKITNQLNSDYLINVPDKTPTAVLDATTPTTTAEESHNTKNTSNPAEI